MLSGKRDRAMPGTQIFSDTGRIFRLAIKCPMSSNTRDQSERRNNRRSGGDGPPELPPTGESVDAGAAGAPEAAKCARCGRQSRSVARYCRYCGNPVVPVISRSPLSRQASSADRPAPRADLPPGNTPANGVTDESLPPAASKNSDHRGVTPGLSLVPILLILVIMIFLLAWFLGR